MTWRIDIDAVLPRVPAGVAISGKDTDDAEERAEVVAWLVEMYRKAEQSAPEPRWSREDVQRVLYHVVTRYQAAVAEFGMLDELLHSAITNVAIGTLKDNNWWPEEDHK